MNYLAQYKNKLTTAQEAVNIIPQRGNISIGMAVSEPPGLLKALEKRVKQAAGEHIEELKVYYMHAEKYSRETIFRYEYMDVIKPHAFFIGKTERELLEKGKQEGRKTVHYVPSHFSAVPGVLAEVGIDVFMVMVSPMDKSGLFSCGTNSDYTLPTARIAKKLIVEVNPNMPRVFGDSCLHISEIDAIVESDMPLPEVTERPTTVLDHKISTHLIELIPNHATLQIGLGGVPNAICEALSAHQGLGIHTELMSAGLMQLIQSGAVSNKYKNINRYKNVYTFAQGNKQLYDFLNDNVTMEIYPVNYVNNPSVISQNDHVISINGFLQIDLAGQVNAETIGDRQYSAHGGQLDFIRGAQLSKGGKSILTAYSTALDGKRSRIVAKVEGAVTDTRADVQYIATEYGVVNLRGKSIAERAVSLIQIAHPDFRDALYLAAKEMKYF